MPDETEISNVFADVGENGLRQLVAAFYRRIPSDDILGPMYPADDLEGSERRLAGFLIFRFGGPDHYLQERGHPQLRMRHAPFAIDAAARERWMSLMNQALDEADLPAKAVAVMRPFLSEVATFLINRGSQPNLIR